MSTVQTVNEAFSREPTNSSQETTPGIRLGTLVKELQAQNRYPQISKALLSTTDAEMQDFYHQALTNQFARVSGSIQNFIARKNAFDLSERNAYFRDRRHQGNQKSDRPWNPPPARKRRVDKQNGTPKPHQILSRVSAKRTNISWITNDGAFAGEVIEIEAAAQRNVDPEHAKTALTAMFGLINAQGIREDHNIGIVNTAEDGTLFMNIVPSIEPLLQEQTL